MTLKTIFNWFDSYSMKEISGRYLPLDLIEPLLKKFGSHFNLEFIGESENGLPLYALLIGNGTKKVLMWSQMHGNESTTTKSVMDLISTLVGEPSLPFMKDLQLCIIPMLNPDGAKQYTRHNANDIDLNRDAADLSQSESLALREIYANFKPHFAFNLHGQRTIFSAGETDKPATLSFLAPAVDQDKSVPPNRLKAMQIISGIHKSMVSKLNSGIGIYNDSFNINCVGDTFQSLGTATILFEAGHFPGDYQREYVRKLMYSAMILGLEAIATENYREFDEADYQKIPMNHEGFYDVVISNACLIDKNCDTTFDIGIQFKERLNEGMIVFIPEIAEISSHIERLGHRHVDANNGLVSSGEGIELTEGSEIDVILINGEVFSLISDKT